MAPRARGKSDARETPPTQLPPGFEVPFPNPTSPEQLLTNLCQSHEDLMAIAAEAAHIGFLLGRKSLLLFIVGFCLEKDMLPPKWARDALVLAYKSGKNWDDVFGKPLRRVKRRLDLERKTYREGRKLRKHGNHKIDEGFFEELGQTLDMSGGTAKDYYYGNVKRRHDEFLAIDRDLLENGFSGVDNIFKRNDRTIERISEKQTPKIRKNKSRRISHGNQKISEK